ncbi:uncharacterized protein LOC133511073 [Syngnathoides biaculeatus]|uniref:uncharacterized protein LOC133511073 n=1 Tax=Syngnathoides biaculeatus TaxID=300417 RepID=UPI002ADD3E2A|nr:uncharacterized protein LOC133511073 [Syngnathoides biaculeatus]XP_061695649.1 uncharacterized protein LOC133511073 [Syngnathoides biaculeatus]
MRASLDMYTEGAQATGHRRFLQSNGTVDLCPCQRCAHHGGPRYQADHPHLDGRRDTQPLWVKDAGGRISRGGHCSPQRRPVFLGPLIQSSDLPQPSPPWELNPAQWSHLPEPGTRHWPSFREQCDCVTGHNHARAHPFQFQIPHPLPHLRVNGPAYGLSRTMFYDEFVDKGANGSACTPQNGHLDHPFPLVNGHSAPKPGPSKRRDTYFDSGGSDCNGHPHKGFFPTEVPQKHLNRDKPKGIIGRSPVVISTEAPVSNQHQELGKQPRGQDSVRDQIRQVVTDLEDVLGGLKQVHVEMKEVIEQIDHLTANMDLGEKPRSVAYGSSSGVLVAVHRGELVASPQSGRRAAPVEWSRRSDEERIILRTNSPSPVHMAAVVKTRCFTQPGHAKDLKHVNGHPPLPDHDYKADNPESRSQNLNPEIVIGNSTTIHSRTQKPPLYPHESTKAARTAEYAWRGRQNNSMV